MSGSGMGSGSSSGGGGIGATGGSGSTSSGTGGSGASGTGSGSTSGAGFSNQFTGAMDTAFSAASQSTGRGGSSSIGGFNATSSSSPFATTFANPLYGGKPGANYSSNQKGGFGTPLYTWQAPNQNITGRLTNTATTAANALRDHMGTTTSAGRRTPGYSTSLRFQAPLPNNGQLHASARALITNATALPSRQNIQVELDGPTIVLRGKVANEDERRLAENVLRLTPGMRNIRNELAVQPTSTAVGQ